MPASLAASVIDTRAIVYDLVRICLYGVCPDMLYHLKEWLTNTDKQLIKLLAFLPGDFLTNRCRARC